jgi:Flp pilus assembly protein TadG
VQRSRPTAVARFAGDDGTALVEAAFFTPLFMFLIFGMAEMGLFFRTYITIGAALADGSRTGSILGNSLDVDYQIIQSVKRDLETLPRSDIKVLVVFKAGSATTTNAAATPVPTACSQPSSATPVSLISVANNCSAYTPTTDWAATDTRFYTCQTTPVPYQNRSGGWCPTIRLAAATATGTAPKGPPDYIGIYLRVNHTYLTGLFGRTKVAEQTMVTRLEPQSLG